MADADVFSAYFVNIFSESHSIDIETAAIMELLNELLSEQLNTDQIALICDEMITCRDFHNNNDSTDQQDLQWEHLVPKGDDDDDDDGNNVGDAYPWTNETAGAEYLDYIEQVWEEGGGGIGEGEGGYEGEGEFGEEDIGYEEDEYYHHYEQLFTKAMEVEEILARVDKCPSIVFSSEAIYAVLWDPYCNGDAETAADSIENAFKTASSAKPCRHMLTGKCYKKDCAFLHEVHDITCRYYLMQQGCAMLSVHDGGDCPFKHTVDVLQLQSQQSSALSSSAAAMKEQDIHSQASFPSLPSASTATPGGAGGGGSARSNGSSSLYAQSEYASALSRSQGGQGLDSGAKTKQTTLTHTGSGGTSSSGRQGSTNLLRSDWVDSGHSVAIDYATLREQARTLAIARNKCLEEATQAYLGGAKGIAKSLSTQGMHPNTNLITHFNTNPITHQYVPYHTLFNTHYPSAHLINTTLT